MSSHHIIREKQEPALLIADIYGIEEELLGQLLEWSPTLIAEADSFESIRSQAYKIDVVFTKENFDFGQEHLVNVMYEADFIGAALQYLIDQGYSAVNVLGKGFDSSRLLSFSEKIDIVWLYDDKRTVFVHSGFEKWKPAGEEVILESHLVDLAVSGLLKQANGHFTTEKDGFYTISFSSPAICLVTEKI